MIFIASTLCSPLIRQCLASCPPTVPGQQGEPLYWTSEGSVVHGSLLETLTIVYTPLAQGICTVDTARSYLSEYLVMNSYLVLLVS